MKTIYSILPLLALLMLPMFAHAVSMSSPAYQIDSARVTSGGGNSASAGYDMAGATIGQSLLIGPSQVSAGYASKPVTLPILSEQALIVSTLSSGAVSASQVVNVSGKVPASQPTISLTITGIPVTINADGSYSMTISLKLGSNTITITSVGQNGVVTTQSRSVTYNPTAAPVSITSIANNSSVPLSQTSSTISGTVGANVTSVDISLNSGSQQTVIPVNGTFSVNSGLLSAGLNTIEVTTTTANGSTSSSALTIWRSSAGSVLAHTGDINGDGVVDIVDALMALKAGVGLVKLTISEISRGDVGPFVNGIPVGDGRIDIEDAILILRKAVGLGW